MCFLCDSKTPIVSYSTRFVNSSSAVFILKSYTVIKGFFIAHLGQLIVNNIKSRKRVSEHFISVTLVYTPQKIIRVTCKHKYQFEAYNLNLDTVMVYSRLVLNQKIEHSFRTKLL